MKKDRILIEKKLIPYKFSILLGAEEFILRVDYNKKYDFFTVGLEDSQGNTLCIAEPIVYGVPLWQDVQQPDKYPALRIIPYSEGTDEKKITFENFGVTTFLYIDNCEEELEIK